MKRTQLVRKTPLEARSDLKRKPIRHKKSSKKNAAYTKELREYIRERDNGLCQVCGGTGEQIHHCIPRGSFYVQWYTIDSVHDERNLCLVCSRCHQRIHDEPGFVDRVISMQEQRFGKLRKDFG